MAGTETRTWTNPADAVCAVIAAIALADTTESNPSVMRDMNIPLKSALLIG
jgi:hypothetical protein